MLASITQTITDGVVARGDGGVFLLMASTRCSAIWCFGFAGLVCVVVVRRRVAARTGA